MQRKDADAPETVESSSRIPGVSEEALALLAESDVIDMHVETYTPMRIFGYDPKRRHDKPPLGGRLYGHLDLPRIEDSGLTGAMWSISTNPFRTVAGRWKLLQENIAKVRELIAESDHLEEASTFSDYRAAREAGKHAVMISVQGGHALDAGVPDRKLPDPGLVRVTLVHLTGTSVGGTSSPLGLGRHLTEHGMALIEMLDEAKVFVDLAHIHQEAFWEAYVVHDRSLPLLVTHTGVQGVKKHWRNLDDAQLRAIAQTGGVVGIIFHAGYLKRRGGPKDARMVVEHIEHAVKVAGEDAVGIGTDFDGFIVPPGDLRGANGYALVVQELLERGMKEETIQKIMGGNFLRALAELRP